MNEKIGNSLDKAGIAASWAGAVHCRALPFLVGILPFVGLSFLLSEANERVFTGISVVLAAFSLLPAYFREHGRLRSIFSAAGIGLIVLTHFFFEENLIAKLIFLLVGAGLISAAHVLNRRLCRACAACSTEPSRVNFYNPPAKRIAKRVSTFTFPLVN